MTAEQMIELLRTIPPETEILVVDDVGCYRRFEKFVQPPYTHYNLWNGELAGLAVVLDNGPALRGW